ncbi:MAG: hypothetical protein EBU36_00945 [Verrucomicrobia bacterium]|nr:hypothetical protein [Verrucomicrobiota bacterium]
MPSALPTRFAHWAMPLILAAAGWIHSAGAQAPVSSWNAHRDFYFDSTCTANNAPAWAGAKAPSATGSAWGYYAANANGNGFPSQIGSYFGASSLYPMANHNPAGGSDLDGALGGHFQLQRFLSDRPKRRKFGRLDRHRGQHGRGSFG